MLILTSRVALKTTIIRALNRATLDPTRRTLGSTRNDVRIYLYVEFLINFIS